MKKILIGIVVILVLAQLADKVFFRGEDSTDNDNTPSNNETEYTYDCAIHQAYFINGHCQKCFAEKATEPMRDNLNHY